MNLIYIHICHFTFSYAANGNWSAWSPSGACSTTCGPGVLIQSRNCSNPRPWGSGSQYCAGGIPWKPQYQRIVCNPSPCPSG